MNAVAGFRPLTLGQRLSTYLLTATMVGSPYCAPAPVTVGLALALKCIAIGVVVSSGYILYKCGAEYYLCISLPDNEEPAWFVSQGTPSTLAKTDCYRCRGPYSTRDEPDMMARANNQSFATNGVPVYICSALATVPGPAPKPIKMTMETSTDSGTTWTATASLVTDTDETCPFGILPPSGTNGLTRMQRLAYAGCSKLVTNTAGAIAIYRVLYEDP